MHASKQWQGKKKSVGKLTFSYFLSFYQVDGVKSMDKTVTGDEMECLDNSEGASYNITGLLSSLDEENREVSGNQQGKMLNNN